LKLFQQKLYYHNKQVEYNKSFKFILIYFEFFLVVVVVLPTKDELLKKREELAIELLWIEQAIQSRKDYLRLKSRYTTSVS
jgi:hypothetical protein